MQRVLSFSLFFLVFVVRHSREERYTWREGGREREKRTRMTLPSSSSSSRVFFFLLCCSARLDPFLSPVYSERCKEWTEGKWREVNSDTVKHFHSLSKQMSARVGRNSSHEKKSRSYLHQQTSERYAKLLENRNSIESKP